MASQRKFRKISEPTNSEEYAERNHNDEEIQKALEEIDSCQNDLDALNEQASEEIIKIEQKFNLLRKPLYEKRNEVINKIPHFWVTTFVNHPDLSTIIGDSEEDCLHHLHKIEVEEFEDIKSGFKINFYFEENPYFENRVITKEYHLAVTEEATSKSTPIKWKDGFDLTQTKHNSPSKSGQKRGIEQKSFFSWFNDHNDPIPDEIAEIIKDDIYINPLQYFLVPDVGVDHGVEDDEGSDQEEEHDDDTGLGGDTYDDTNDISNAVPEESPTV